MGTRSRFPAITLSEPSVMVPSSQSSNNNPSTIDLSSNNSPFNEMTTLVCPNENNIGVNRGGGSIRRGGLEILADASTASRTTPGNNNNNMISNTSTDKKPGTTTTSKNKRKAPSRSTTAELKVSPGATAQASKTAATTTNEQEACCICLTPPLPGDVASVNGCDHVFCFDCIEKWAERENTCPLCKQRFTKIDRVNKKKRRTKDEVAAKAPVCKNTKTVRNRNQAADRGRIPIQDLIATMDVPESAPGRNFFHLLFSSPIGSQLGLDLVSGGSSSSPLGSNFPVDDIDNEHNFFSEDDESFDGEFQSFIFNRQHHHHRNTTNNINNPMSVAPVVSMSGGTTNINPFSSINLQQPNPLRGTTPDTALEIHDSDDDDDDDVMIIMNHNNEQSQQQQQRPPTPHPYV